MVNSPRIQQVIDSMKRRSLKQIIVSEDRALSYLTGHRANSMERVGVLLIKSSGEIHSFMNVLFRFPEISGATTHYYRDGEDPYSLIAECLDPGEVGFDDTWESKHTISLLMKRNDITPVLGSWPVNEARKIKDAEEQTLLRTAAAINDDAVSYGFSCFGADVTETELAGMIEEHFCRNGGVNVGQYQVVCFGANAADPHHVPDSTTAEKGGAVLLDLVGLINGYWCDMTRTVFYGSVSDENRLVYDTVLKSQTAGIAAVRPGTAMRDIDAAARKVIEDAGFGQYFITRTGHGVGLSIHEPPMCAPDSDEICRAGMCFSIEPGIYLPGKTGVRIEDLVIVTEDGCEVLTHYTRELQII
jgi:Xaa-Pro aminopeptidase